MNVGWILGILIMVIVSVQYGTCPMSWVRSMKSHFCAWKATYTFLRTELILRKIPRYMLKTFVVITPWCLFGGVSCNPLLSKMKTCQTFKKFVCWLLMIWGQREQRGCLNIHGITAVQYKSSHYKDEIYPERWSSYWDQALGFSGYDIEWLVDLKYSTERDNTSCFKIIPFKSTMKIGHFL